MLGNRTNNNMKERRIPPFDVPDRIPGSSFGHRQPTVPSHSKGTSNYHALGALFRVSTLAFGKGSHRRLMKRVRMVVRALAHFKTWHHWYDFIRSSPFGDIAQHHPRLYEKPLRPYLFRDMAGPECYQLLREHYLFVQQNLPLSFIHALSVDQSYILNIRTISELKVPLFINLCYARHMRQEGELTLTLGTQDSLTSLAEHAWIAALAFVVRRGASGWEIVVGGAQGGHAGGTGKAGARLATRVFYGVRPKYLLIDVLQQLALHWHISHIYAVGDHAHVFKRLRYRKRVTIRASYNELWTQAGGVPTTNGFFLLPLEKYRRPLDLIESHKRAEYKRRYRLLDAIHAEIGELFADDVVRRAVG